MHNIKQSIENNPGWSMIVLSFAGLAFPYGDLIPGAVIISILAILMFLSCFRISVPLMAVVSWRPFAFCFLRFALAPIVLWAICHQIAPAFAIGVLLLALVPAGTSSAALTGLYNGNVAMALVITIASSIGSVFLIPSIIGFLNHSIVAVPVFSVLKTLVLCILMPGGLYLLLRKRAFLNDYNKSYGRFTSVVLISVLAFVGLSKRRDYFLVNPQDMIIPFLVVAAFFAFAILAGFAFRAMRQDRIAYGICSSFNNTSLGVGLSLLYFDEKTTAVMIAALFLWSFLPLAVQPIIKRL